MSTPAPMSLQSLAPSAVPGGGCRAFRISPPNPSLSWGSTPGNPRGRSRGSAPFPVTAPPRTRGRKLLGAAPPLPGTRRSESDTPPRPEGPGVLRARQPEGNGGAEWAWPSGGGRGHAGGRARLRKSEGSQEGVASEGGRAWLAQRLTTP